MKRLLIALALISVLVGAILVLPSFIDWNKHRGQIIAQLHEATGYEFRIGGDIDLALLPYPRLRIAELEVSNPPRAAQPLLTLREAAISVELAPLLRGMIVVDSIRLNSPAIRVGIAEDGTPTWMTPVLESRLNAGAKENGAGAGTEKTGDNPFAGAISLDSVRISDGALSYEDARSGASHAAEKINLEIRSDTLSGPFMVTGGLSYGGQAFDLSMKTGRINTEANTVAVQAEIKSAAAGAMVNFSGVAALKGALDVQGSFGVTAANAGALAALTGKPAPAFLAGKSVNASGVLTASPSAVSYKDMKLSYAGITATGSLTATHLEKGGEPLDVAVVLNVAQPVDLGAILPASAQPAATGGKAAPVPGASPSAFLPETITVPADMTAQIRFAAPGLSYNGMSFGATSLSGEMKGQALKGAITTTPPGGGSLALDGDLSFAKSARTADAGSVTLSGPTLRYKFVLQSEDGAKTALALAGAEKIKNILPLLQEGLGVDLSGTLTPRTAKIDNATAKIGRQDLAFSGAYALPVAPGGRPMLTVSASTPRLDIDDLSARLNPPTRSTGQAAVAPAPKTDIAASLSKFALPFDLDLSVSARNVRLKATDYQALDLRALLNGPALDLRTLQLRDGKGNDILVAGKAANLPALKGLDLRAQGKTADLPALLEGFGANVTALPATLKAAELVSEFKGEADKLAFTANIKAMGGSLEASGNLTGVLKTPAVDDLTVRLRHTDYAAMAKLFNPEFRAAPSIPKTLDLYALMKRDGKAYRFSDMNATIGPAQITGEIAADMGGAKPAITANLATGDFPLGALLGYEPKAKGGSASGGAAAPASAQAQGARWSRNAINTDWMHKFNVNFKATSKSFSYGTWMLTNARIDAALTNGTLTVTQLDGGMYGGQASLSGSMASSGKPRDPLVLDGKAALKGVSLESFVSSFSGSRLVKASGNVSVDTAVRSTGISPAALIFALQGEGKASGSDLVFEGFDLAALSRTLAQPSSSMTENLTGLLDGTMKRGSTRFDTLSAAFNIREGVVSFTDMTLTGKDAVVATQGTVNLPSWALDLESRISLTEPKDAPPLTVTFRGPLDQPAQTFGRSAMEGYLRNIIGSRVQNVIQDKLQDKLKGTEGDILRGVLGLPSGGGQQPQPAQPAQPAQPQKQQAPAALEKGFNDLLQGVMQGR